MKAPRRASLGRTLVRGALVLAACLVAGLALADKVLLTNGDAVVGEIIRQDKDGVVVKTEFGEVPIAKEKIKSILYTNRPAPERINVYLRGGRAWRGDVLEQDRERILLRVEGGATLPVMKTNIEKIDWKSYLSWETPRDAGLAAGWRSLVAPSWGQFWSGRPVAGWISLGTCGGLAAASLVSYLSYQSALRSYNDWPTASRYERADARRKTSNLFITLTAVAWILNAADAALFAPKEHRGPVLAMGWDDAARGMTVGVRMGF